MADIDADEANDSQSQSDTPEYVDPDPDGQTLEQENEVDSGSSTDDPDVENQEQDADSILEEQQELYQQTHTLWNDSNPDFSSKKLLRHIQMVRMSKHAFDHLQDDTKCEFLTKLVSPLIETGTLQVVCDILVLGLQGNTDCEATSNRMRKRQEAMMTECLQIVNNFIDPYQESIQVVVDHKDLLPMLVKKLDEWYTPDEEGMQLGLQETYINKSLTTLFLVSNEEENTHANYLRGINNCVSVIKKYLSSKVEKNRLTAIALLANMADDDETEDIATDEDMVRLLLEQLRQTFTENGESSSPLTRLGLVRVVKNLARNDANKQLLVKEGALPLLEKGLKPEYQQSTDNGEKKWCLESLWWLSTDPEIYNEMIKNETLLELVVDIYLVGPTSDCFVPAECILNQLWDDLPIKYKENVDIENMHQDEESDSESKLSADQVQHVMISYQTQYRPVAKMICDFLQQKGVKMWMDIHNMSEGVDSTVETMAKAVEGAKVVLIFVSKSYKDSTFCKHEALYAFKKNKVIIPLKVQRGYEPDGWLGFLESMKFSYDLTRDDPDYTKNKKSQLYDTICKIYASEGAI